MVVMVVENDIMVMFDNNHHPSSGFHAADCRATLSQAKLLQGCLRCKILLHIFLTCYFPSPPTPSHPPSLDVQVRPQPRPLSSLALLHNH